MDEEKQSDPRLQATPETDPDAPPNEDGAPTAKGFETEANKEQPPDQEAFQTDSD